MSRLYGNPVCARVNEPNIADLCGVSIVEVNLLETPGKTQPQETAKASPAPSAKTMAM